MGKPLHDFAQVLKTVFRFARTLSYGLIVVFLVWGGFQVYQVTRWAGEVHWALGVAVFLLIALALGWLVGRPLVRFLKMPAAVKPPVLPPAGERTARDMGRHLDFVERYLEAIGRNPEWTGPPEAVPAAVAACRSLAADAARAAPGDLPDLERRLRVLERETVAALLSPLDRKASDAIRAEAVAVGITTALSPNGRIDAFLVLWRASNLVARISNLYYGRPGARGTLTILRDVSGAVLASAYLQDLSEMAGTMVGAVAGQATGVFAGPLLDGSLNAVAMLRIGYLAKARCRAFDGWTERTRAEAVRGALREAGHLARGVVADLVRTVGGGILKLPLRLLGKLTDAVGGLFRTPESGPGEA